MTPDSVEELVETVRSSISVFLSRDQRVAAHDALDLIQERLEEELLVPIGNTFAANNVTPDTHTRKGIGR